MLELPIADLQRQDCGRLNFNQLHARLKPDVLIERRARDLGVTMALDKIKDSDVDPVQRALMMKVRLEVMAEVDHAVEAKEANLDPDHVSQMFDGRTRTGRELIVDLLMEQRGVPGVDFHRSGRELWSYLRPRLKFIVELQKEWGNVHNLYPSRRDSVFEDVPLPLGIRDPDSLPSGMWDLFGLVLLICVSILVPLRSCFGLEVNFCIMYDEPLHSNDEFCINDNELCLFKMMNFALKMMNSGSINDDFGVTRWSFSLAPGSSTCSRMFTSSWIYSSTSSRPTTTPRACESFASA